VCSGKGRARNSILASALIQNNTNGNNLLRVSVPKTSSFKNLQPMIKGSFYKNNISYPAYGTWMADVMLWQNESRAFFGKYLNDPRVPWKQKKREMMTIAWMIPVQPNGLQKSNGDECTLHIIQKGARTTRCEH